MVRFLHIFAHPFLLFFYPMFVTRSFFDPGPKPLVFELLFLAFLVSRCLLHCDLSQL
jgi:hypothetical protein